MKSTLMGLGDYKCVGEGNEGVGDGNNLVLSLVDLHNSKSLIRDRKVRREH